MSYLCYLCLLGIVVCLFVLFVFVLCLVYPISKHTYKTKDRVTRTPREPGVNSGTPEGLEVSAPLVTPIVLI
jgi:hypothetical protein